jgi:hypothetical protein
MTQDAHTTAKLTALMREAIAIKPSRCEHFGPTFEPGDSTAP